MHFPRAPEQFVTSPLCLVGYVRWDARSDRVPPLQTIIFSSFPGRTKGCRQYALKAPGANALLLLQFLRGRSHTFVDESPKKKEIFVGNGETQILGTPR